MSIINMDFYQAGQELNSQIDSLSAALKGYKWSITKENLGTCYIQNALHVSTLYTLSSLVKKVCPQENPTLNLLEKKILDSNELIGILADPANTDPRLFTLVTIKIPKLHFRSLHREQKIVQYSDLLEKFKGSDPQVPKRKIARAQMQLRRASLTTECPKHNLSKSMECPSLMLSLQEAINALSSQSPEGFSRALDGILELDELTFTPYAERNEKKVTGRIFSHLQSIHKKEVPEKLNPNASHKSDAFFSQGTSFIEKLRAVQRTQVEVCLFALDECLKGDLSIDSPVAGKTPIVGIFEILENLQLDPKDLPENQKNVAHALFGKIYATYLAAWENDKSMVHPHDGIFTSDFGRYAFMSDSEDRVPHFLKTQVLTEVRQSLKEVWGL